jgi:hypothetical protein
VILLGAAAIAGPGAAKAAEGLATNYVSIETPAGGEPMLVVRYPWTVHKNPSIEVRTYIPGEEESARIRPLRFCHVYMKDKVTVTVYDTQAASSAVRTTAEFLQRDIKFEAVGQRNVLGRPAVCVTCETEVLKPNREAFRDKARWAIYPFMEPWAADKETLFLSLPEPIFSDPVKIRIFFLRDNDLVWSETRQWPGLKKPGEATVAKQPPKPGDPAAAPATQPAGATDAAAKEPAVPTAAAATNPFGP